MPTTQLSTVADLVITMPAAVNVLERLGIDFCCHGQQSVEQACTGRGITVDALLGLIESEPKPAGERPWSNAPMTDIIRFIVDSHHRYTREAIAFLPPVARKVREVHGERHPELVEVEELTRTIAAELLPHMLKEEQILFPFIIALEGAMSAGTTPPMPFFGTVKNPVRMMMLEHETVGEKLAEIRVLTSGYELPEGACNSYRILFEKLQELEGDLHRHIHLENNILFLKAIEAEEKAAVPTFEMAEGETCGGGCSH
ncbi:MAG TPA: iron-sulfur cluster repair di-iron protein [Thermoanaerobaculia bacterium]|nr:iron-sulfur cluster repair di-iron protein [Thermoanaerobaculia bacterium]